LALGVVVLLFALGFRKGVLDFVLQQWQRRSARFFMNAGESVVVTGGASGIGLACLELLASTRCKRSRD
jgi:NADPH:quinone reductase-like Zn-dependent oxidoreductase